MSEVSAAVLQGARPTSYLVLWVTALFFVAAGVWAYYAPLDEVTVGVGRVIPSSQVQVIQNLEGGIVSEILVGEGDVVAAGDMLLRLDDTRFSSSFGESRLQRSALEARIARLSAEAEGAEFQAPTGIAQSALAMFDRERSLFESRRRELESNLRILEQQSEQKQQDLAELRARKKRLEGSVGLLRREYAISAPLAREGVISEVEILRLRRELNDLRGEFDSVALSIPKAESALSEIAEKMGELRVRFRTDAMDALTEAQTELSRLGENLRAAEDRFTRTAVRSPVRGTIKKLHVATVGGVIQPGMDLVEIVPLDGSLLVEARIRPADIAFLRPGQEATVKLTAYDYSIYGGLSARLEHISADTIADEDGESFYLIRLRTDDILTGPDGGQLDIIPGMTALVDILTGKKTVMEYLLKPVLKAKAYALRER